MTAALELQPLPTRPAVAARSPSQDRLSFTGSLKGEPSLPGLHDLARLGRTPSTAESTVVSTFEPSPGAEAATVELEPVDKGRGAYIFLLNAFMLEVSVCAHWGAPDQLVSCGS